MNHSVAIHDRPGSFSDRWFERARCLGIQHASVDCLRSTIISELRGHSGLLWHWTHERATDLLIARSIIQAAETMGLRVFPDSATCATFDDKLGQKYLLEAVSAPLAPTHVFFTEDAALEWIETAGFPKVFKLRRGAGSSNVHLVPNAGMARRLVHRAFGKGFSPAASPLQDASLRYARAKARGDLRGAALRLPRTLFDSYRRASQMDHERGYVYFQEFFPGNAYDTRVTVIGDRAFAFTRNVRKNDFRASGSGSIDYDLSRIRPECVAIALEVAHNIGAQSLAFDFAVDGEQRPHILEISYCYQAKAVYDCPGYWTRTLEWHAGHVWPQDAILDDMLATLSRAPNMSRRAPRPTRSVR